MTKTINGRLDKIEENLVISQDKKEHLRYLTFLANLKRVPTVVLMEGLLSIIEKAFFPDEPSREPEFVERELQRRVSKKKLQEVSDNATHSIDNERLGAEVYEQLDEYAGQVSEYLNADASTIPVGFKYPGWDAQLFLDRWERTKEKWTQHVDTQGVE
jgi:methionine salvage enolase-phosphatase E1